MNTTAPRHRLLAVLSTLALLITSLPALADHVSSRAPTLINPGFECSEGYGPQSGINGLVPDGWTATLLHGNPELNSTRIKWTGVCGDTGFVERIEGMDSMIFESEDIETPPLPGKPFDAVVYQQTTVVPGLDYSLSSWMVTLCGGAAQPNDCPQGYYIAKMLGIDPTGGVDPLAPSVIWIEDRRNFVESGWANLRMGVTAQTDTMTVFGRINSPFQWHGAFGFMDAFSLMEAPGAHFVDLPSNVQGSQVTVSWEGSLGPDIPTIPAGAHQLVFDIQTRDPAQATWTDWRIDQPTGQAVYVVGSCQDTQTIEFRLRARAEQPEGVPGSWPNHRYPGVWSEPTRVTFDNSFVCAPRAYLPLLTIR